VEAAEVVKVGTSTRARTRGEPRNAANAASLRAHVREGGDGLEEMAAEVTLRSHPAA